MIRVSLCEPNPFQRASLQFFVTLVEYACVHVCVCGCLACTCEYYYNVG